MTPLLQVQLLEQNLNSVRARIMEASNVMRSLNDSLRSVTRHTLQNDATRHIHIIWSHQPLILRCSQSQVRTGLSSTTGRLSIGSGTSGDGKEGVNR